MLNPAASVLGGNRVVNVFEDDAPVDNIVNQTSLRLEQKSISKKDVCRCGQHP